MRAKIGRNDPCWCGSGKKYKKCHLGRAKQEPLSPQEVIYALERQRKSKNCFHPEAKPTVCKGGIVHAHTVPRKGSLQKIAKQGHVYTFKHNYSAFSRPEPPLKIEKIGIGQASTFFGFCQLHDKILFSPLEDSQFIGSNEQCFLLTYRSLCRELFTKTGQYNLLDFYKNADNGRDAFTQDILQDFLRYYSIGVAMGFSDLQKLKTIFDSNLMANDFSKIGYYIVELDSPPDLMGSGGIIPEFDFNGNALANLGIKYEIPTYLSFSAIATDTGGALVFSWLGDHYGFCKQFAVSLHEINNDNIIHACVRFAFEFIENTFFAPDWWDGLGQTTRDNLVKRFLYSIDPTNPRRPTCLIDDGVRAVSWKVTNRYSTAIN